MSLCVRGIRKAFLYLLFACPPLQRARVHHALDVGRHDDSFDPAGARVVADLLQSEDLQEQSYQ